MQTPSKAGRTINPTVFYTSACLIIVLVLFASIFPTTAKNNFDHIQTWIIDHVSWFCNPPSKPQRLFVENSINMNSRSFLCVNQNSLRARLWQFSNKM
ncbi:hypothetical protein TOI97_12520, partial [Denitrificimonas sp. JX-1]